MSTAPAIHPRLLPAAQAQLQRLKSEVRAACNFIFEDLKRIEAKLEELAACYDLPNSKRIVVEIERTLEEIHAYAAAEAFDMVGILAVQRRLMAICEDLGILSAATMPQSGDGQRSRATAPMTRRATSPPTTKRMIFDFDIALIAPRARPTDTRPNGTAAGNS